MPISPISVSVPASLATTWKARAKSDSATQVDVLLDAVAGQREELKELVAAHRLGSRPVVSPPADGLFVRRPEAVATLDPFVAVSLRMLSANVDILDGLVHEVGAESRSQLVAAALEAWLREPE